MCPSNVGSLGLCWIEYDCVVCRKKWYTSGMPIKRFDYESAISRFLMKPACFHTSRRGYQSDDRSECTFRQIHMTCAEWILTLTTPRTAKETANLVARERCTSTMKVVWDIVRYYPRDCDDDADNGEWRRRYAKELKDYEELLDSLRTDEVMEDGDDDDDDDDDDGAESISSVASLDFADAGFDQSDDNAQDLPDDVLDAIRAHESEIGLYPNTNGTPPRTPPMYNEPPMIVGTTDEELDELLAEWYVEDEEQDEPATVTTTTTTTTTTMNIDSDESTLELDFISDDSESDYEFSRTRLRFIDFDDYNERQE